MRKTMQGSCMPGMIEFIAASLYLQVELQLLTVNEKGKIHIQVIS